MATASATDLSLSFPCGSRGYHEYRALWTPILHKILPSIHERSNPYDRYAIAARNIFFLVHAHKRSYNTQLATRARIKRSSHTLDS